LWHKMMQVTYTKKAFILRVVREGMAQKLADVVFRRTTLGIAGDRRDACLMACAAITARERSRDGERVQRGMEEVRTAFSIWSSTP
jgi:glycerol-3-phosphate dehydrogenase